MSFIWASPSTTLTGLLIEAGSKASTRPHLPSRKANKKFTLAFVPTGLSVFASLKEKVSESEHETGAHFPHEVINIMKHTYWGYFQQAGGE